MTITNVFTKLLSYTEMRTLPELICETSCETDLNYVNLMEERNYFHTFWNV